MRGSKIIDPKNDDELFQMQRNPDVSVRFRGVMEKCTYCTQRINRGRRAAALAGENTQAGRAAIRAITPACAQVCAPKAITFGDLNDAPSTPFNQRRNRDRNYQLLTELNLRPRTTYLGKVRNVNPKLNGKKDG